MDMNRNKLGDSGGQRSLVCYSPRGDKESEQLINWTTTKAYTSPKPQEFLFLLLGQAREKPACYGSKNIWPIPAPAAPPGILWDHGY